MSLLHYGDNVSKRNNSLFDSLPRFVYGVHNGFIHSKDYRSGKLFESNATAIPLQCEDVDSFPLVTGCRFLPFRLWFLCHRLTNVWPRHLKFVAYIFRTPSSAYIDPRSPVRAIIPKRYSIPFAYHSWFDNYIILCFWFLRWLFCNVTRIARIPNHCHNYSAGCICIDSIKVKRLGYATSYRMTFLHMRQIVFNQPHEINVLSIAINGVRRIFLVIRLIIGGIIYG